MPPLPRAVLVGVLVQGRDPADLDASLDELARLGDTLGLREVGRVTQRRSGTGSANLLGAGQLRLLAAWTGGSGVVSRGPPGKSSSDDEAEDEPDYDPVYDEQVAALPPLPSGEPRVGPDDDPAQAWARHRRRADVVVVDHELTPSQLRNLKRACGVEVLDRNGVIIEIFSQRAASREARLQVELARLAYIAPRLRELGGPSERQRGGIGGKGAGETGLELDRRRVRDRMSEVRRELADIESSRHVRRQRRHDLRQVALVGYTNAGKSSLMRTLTGAEPYVANQLFATLDTTIRRLHPEAQPAVLITDTVGFIKDLPHSLVASFRSTLDAALEAGLLLHVVDASDPSWPQQEEVTARVLAEIGADDLPRVLLFNKCDCLPEGAEEALLAQRPDAWTTSAHDAERVAALHARIVRFFAEKDPEFELFVPWSNASVMGLVRAQALVVEESFEDEGVRYRLRAPAQVAERLQAAAAES